MLESAILALRGASPETRQRRSGEWRPAAAARNRLAPGGPGPRPPGTTTWLRGASLHGDRRKCRRRKRGPRPKTATVERREASVPNGDAPRLYQRGTSRPTARH